MAEQFHLEPTIVVSAAPVGFHVEVLRDRDDLNRDMWFEDLEYAQAYARGLSIGSGWPVEDRTCTAFPDGRAIYVEQLNASQWHTRRPSGGYGGADNWVRALSEALFWADVDHVPVVSVALDGTRMTFTDAETRPASRGARA